MNKAPENPISQMLSTNDAHSSHVHHLTASIRCAH